MSRSGSQAAKNGDNRGDYDARQGLVRPGSSIQFPTYKKGNKRRFCWQTVATISRGTLGSAIRFSSYRKHRRVLNLQGESQEGSLMGDPAKTVCGRNWLAQSTSIAHADGKARKKKSLMFDKDWPALGDP